MAFMRLSQFIGGADRIDDIASVIASFDRYKIKPDKLSGEYCVETFDKVISVNKRELIGLFRRDNQTVFGEFKTFGDQHWRAETCL